MRINRSLLDDVEKIYYSFRCNTEWSCNLCKYDGLCIIIHDLLNSLRKFY